MIIGASVFMSASVSSDIQSGVPVCVVCVCVQAPVHVCVCVCVCARVFVHACMCTNVAYAQVSTQTSDSSENATGKTFKNNVTHTVHRIVNS